MDSSFENLRMKDLIQQLRLYKAPTLSVDKQEEEIRDERSGKIISQTAVADVPVKKFRPKRAAVLICLFEDDAGDLRVILTKRSSNLSNHSGEVSLPGGKTDEGDKDDIETAMREAKEEIGLDPSLVTVVTVLEPFVTKYQLGVIPVVGILSEKDAFKTVLNPDEVETIFDCPLEMFLKNEKHRSEKKEWMGVHYLMHFFDYEVGDKKYTIWGMTAWILIGAASVVFQRPPCFEVKRPYFICAAL